MMPKRSKMKTLPAVAATAVSMVLTVVVVVMWLGEAMHWALALVVGLGLDGMWLATLAYERRMAAQGDHNKTVTRVGWGFGGVATAVLVAHAVTGPREDMAAWLAVAWLPLAAKALWMVHGLWERTALTDDALKTIRDVLQDARDRNAVDRARLMSAAHAEEVRLDAVASAGARVAKARAKAARELDEARAQLGEAPAAAAVPGGWELPGLAPVPELEPAANTPEHGGEHDGQVDADRSNVVALNRANTGEHAPNIAGLAREQVAAGASNDEAVANILQALPSAKPDSVAATVRRERRKVDARPYM